MYCHFLLIFAQDAGKGTFLSVGLVTETIRGYLLTLLGFNSQLWGELRRVGHAKRLAVDDLFSLLVPWCLLSPSSLFMYISS